MLDLTKPVQTRGGFKARIICTDAKGTQPVVALIEDENGGEILKRYNANGAFWPSGNFPNTYDLVKTPEKHTVWVNVWEGGGSARFQLQFDSLEEADANLAEYLSIPQYRLLARTRYEYQDEEGLNAVPGDD